MIHSMKARSTLRRIQVAAARPLAVQLPCFRLSRRDLWKSCPRVRLLRKPQLPPHLRSLARQGRQHPVVCEARPLGSPSLGRARTGRRAAWRQLWRAGLLEWATPPSSPLSPQAKRLQAVSLTMAKVVGPRCLTDIRDALLGMDVEALGGHYSVTASDGARLTGTAPTCHALPLSLTNLRSPVVADGAASDAARPCRGEQELGVIRKCRPPPPDPLMQLDTVLAGVAAYAGDSAQLPPPDRFAKEVMLAVPGFFGRVRMLDFLHTRTETYDACLEHIGSIEAVVREIRASASFRDLLIDYILPLGNKLNAHGRKAAVRGRSSRSRCSVPGHSLPFLPHTSGCRYSHGVSRCPPYNQKRSG